MKCKYKDKESSIIITAGLLSIVLFIVICLSSCMKPLDCTFETLREVDITENDNRSIKMHGYMSPYSPEDGSFIYLTSRPYDMKPSPTIGSSFYNSGVHVYPKSAASIVFTGVPVTVSGTVKLTEGSTDDFGINYDWCIVNAEVTPLEDDLMTEKLYNYSRIAANGVLDAVITAMLAVDYDINYIEYDYEAEVSDLQVYSTDNLLMCLNYKELLASDEYADLCEIIVELGNVLNNCNILIEAGKYEDLENYKTDYYNVYMKFNNWLGQFVIEEV